MTDEEIVNSQDPSFLRRLAGPSVNKAGLAKDQTEVNRIIAEASKGTKFYENEKRRDADWTLRINKILARRDELLAESDIGRVEAKVDRIFADMEAKRDLSQIIVHVDMDAFYANVELLHNPDLKSKPFAVVGLGIVTTASYDARKFGVRSAMPEFIAQKLCPEIILVPVDYKRVGVMSSMIMSVCKEYDPNMFVAGCDEGYLNITKYIKEHNLDADDCVQQLRARIFKETNLTASAGIAANMMLAKICSDKNKPNGQYHLPHTRDAIMEFMRDLPVRKIPGIGRVGERVLESLGIKTCGDIHAHRAIIWLMPKRFAVDFLFQTHLGISLSEVRPAQREERKSVGAARTFRPVKTTEAIYEKLEYIASLLEHDLEASGWAGRVVILTVKRDTFRCFTRRATFKRLISKKKDLFEIGKALIDPCLPLTVRLLGLRVTDLKDLHAPEDLGIKRYFQSEGQSPSKKRKLSNSIDVHDNTDDIVPHLDKEDPTLDSPILLGLDVTQREGEDAELISETAPAWDNDNDDDNDDELHINESEGNEPIFVKPEQEQERERERVLPKKVYNIPIRYAKPQASSAIVKVGNDRSKLRSKPVSLRHPTPQRARSMTPSRSKSEQPSLKRASLSRASREPSVTPFSRQETPEQQLPSSNQEQRQRQQQEQKQTEKRLVTCPICNKEMEMDNTSLNQHIDYCLSRSAIMEAASPNGPSPLKKKR